jgi:hypothetical protein
VTEEPPKKDAEAPKAEEPAGFDLKKFIEALTAATTSSVSLPKDQLAAPPLTFQAMEDAAGEVARRLLSKLPKETPPESQAKILVTSDADLVSSGIAYVEADAAIEALTERSAVLLEPPVAAPDGGARSEALSVATATAFANAIPAILGLLSTKRTVQATDVPANDLAAATAVVAILAERGANVVHDTFRIVPLTGRIDRLSQLMNKRTKLLKKKLELPPKSPLRKEMEAAIGEIDALDAALRLVPDGATGSMLRSALIGEVLQADYKHLLLVKSQGGYSRMILDEMSNLVSNDMIHILSEVAITFMLIDAVSSVVKSSGTVTGNAQARGKLGAETLPVYVGYRSEPQGPYPNMPHIPDPKPEGGGLSKDINNEASDEVSEAWTPRRSI